LKCKERFYKFSPNWARRIPAIASGFGEEIV
jgi:hypothetical protein